MVNQLGDESIIGIYLLTKMTIPVDESVIRLVTIVNQLIDESVIG